MITAMRITTGFIIWNFLFLIIRFICMIKSNIKINEDGISECEKQKEEKFKAKVTALAIGNLTGTLFFLFAFLILWWIK